MASYIAEVATACGLGVQRSELALSVPVGVGFVDGLVVVIDPAPVTGRASSNAIEIRVRAAAIVDAERVRAALAPMTSLRRRLRVEARGVCYTWAYALRKPRPEAVRAALTQILLAVRGAAAGVGHCEVCHGRRALAALLVGDEPEVLCAACRQPILEARSAAEAALARMPARLAPAAVLSFVIAMAGGELIALGMGYFNQRGLSAFFWATAGLGIVIGAVAAAAAGRSTPQVKMIARLAATAGVYIPFFRLTGELGPGLAQRPTAALIALVILWGLWFLWLPWLAATVTADIFGQTLERQFLRRFERVQRAPAGVEKTEPELAETLAQR